MAATDESPPPNWLDLPGDIVTTILQKLGAVEIFLNAQPVCPDWRYLCRKPEMWHSIDMPDARDLLDEVLVKMCREAIDRSLGSCVDRSLGGCVNYSYVGCIDINIEYFGTDELLKYTTDRCKQIRRLRLVCCQNITDEGLSEAATKLRSLEDLELSYCSFSREALETVGQYCPFLNSLKLNSVRCPFTEYDGEAQAIGENMHGLRHLQLIGNHMTNEGLEVILDGCPHLEYLDLRRCYDVDMEGDLGIRCTEQIKDLRHPYDPTDDYEFDAFDADESFDDDYQSDYDNYYDSDYDDFFVYGLDEDQ